MLAIQMLADALQDQEDPVPHLATEKISEALSELEELLREQAVDAPFRRAAMSLVDALRRLTRDYPVFGAEALRVTYRHLIVDWGDLPTARTETEKKARSKHRAIISAVGFCASVALRGAIKTGELAHAAKEIEAALPAAHALIGTGARLLGAGTRT